MNETHNICTFPSLFTAVAHVTPHKWTCNGENPLAGCYREVTAPGQSVS